MTRSKFPETVPFRLTRMLINAMEVRTTCYREHEGVAAVFWSTLHLLMAC